MPAEFQAAGDQKGAVISKNSTMPGSICEQVSCLFGDDVLLMLSSACVLIFLFISRVVHVFYRSLPLTASPPGSDSAASGFC